MKNKTFILLETVLIIVFIFLSGFNAVLNLTRNEMYRYSETLHMKEYTYIETGTQTEYFFDEGTLFEAMSITDQYKIYGEVIYGDERILIRMIPYDAFLESDQIVQFLEDKQQENKSEAISQILFVSIIGLIGIVINIMIDKSISRIKNNNLQFAYHIVITVILVIATAVLFASGIWLHR